MEEAGPAGLFTAAGGQGGGAAPCPRSSQRSRPPTYPPAPGSGRTAATAMAFLKLRDQVGEGRRNRATEEPQEGGPAAWAARVPAQRGGCEGSGCPELGTARGCSLGPSACQCSPGSGKPTCRRGIAAATTGAGSALAALASGALPGRRLLFPAR